MTFTKNLHWFIYPLFALGCASQTSPTGGPKDTIPPVLVRSHPANEAINFQGNSIELEFSEDVNLNAPKEQLIVTPTIGKDYKITVRRNTLRIEFEEPLKENTTYTFNFREAVQDITERNPVRNLSVAYSTGPYIDSLSIEGTVSDLLKGTPLKDATVALHIPHDTIYIFQHAPNYFTKTDEKGRFRISHLKPDNYFLYAFEDKNRNLIVNSRTESYGFQREDLYLIENISNLSLGLIRLDAGPLRVTSARPFNTYFNIRTSKYLRTFTLTATDSSDLSYTFGEDQANIRIYNTTQKKDSLQVRLIALDSIDNLIDTTLYAKFSTREVTPEKFTLRLNNSSLHTSTGLLRATFQLSKPLQHINHDSIFFQYDSLTRVNITSEDLTWDPFQRTLTLSKQLDRTRFNAPAPPTASRRPTRPQPNTPVQQPEAPPAPLNELHLRPAAFISVDGDTSEHNVEAIKPLHPEELSIIHIEIRTAEPSYIVQLLDKDLKPVQVFRNQPRVAFRNLVPAEYQIRLIIDRNENGRWDPGNYFKRTEPEPIIYYRAADGSKNIKGVKANWEIGTEGEMFITY